MGEEEDIHGIFSMVLVIVVCLHDARKIMEKAVVRNMGLLFTLNAD